MGAGPSAGRRAGTVWRRRTRSSEASVRRSVPSAYSYFHVNKPFATRPTPCQCPVCPRGALFGQDLQIHSRRPQARKAQRLKRHSRISRNSSARPFVRGGAPPTTRACARARKAGPMHRGGAARPPARLLPPPPNRDSGTNQIVWSRATAGGRSRVT